MQWNVTEQQSELHALLAAIKRGEEVVLTQNGDAIAQLIAVEIPNTKIRLGVFPKEIKSNLLEPTDQSIIDLFYGKN